MIAAFVRVVRGLVLLAGVLCLSGCYTRHPGVFVPVPLPDPVEVEVEGRTVLVHAPRVEEDSILTGWKRTAAEDSVPVRIPLGRETRELDVLKTVLLVAGITVTVATVALVALLDALFSW